MSFLDISVGWPGSLHDARVFRRSTLGRRLDREGLHPYLILGDSAYPQKTYLIVPFRDDGHMSPDQKKFNNVCSASRVIIEQSFTRLKGKWRCLKHLDMENMQLLSRVITSAFVLHNFVIAHDPPAAAESTNQRFSAAANSALSHRLSATQRRTELLHLVT